MYKKMIKYTDYDGNEREEPFYFNLNKAEVVKWEGMTNGGLRKLMEKIIQTIDQAALITIFEDIIGKAYGEKSPDGKFFRKTPEILENFKSTEAYSNLFMELASSDEAASEFINSILPEELLEAARQAEAEEAEKAEGGEAAPAKKPLPIYESENGSIK